MTTTLPDAVGAGLGLAIGVGFGVMALKMIGALPANERTEIEKILNKSHWTGTDYQLLVRNQNKIKARRLLEKAGFKIKEEFDAGRGITEIYFVEKVK